MLQSMGSQCFHVSVHLCFKPATHKQNLNTAPPHPPLPEAGDTCIAMQGWNDWMGQEERMPGAWTQLGRCLEDSPVGLLRCREGEAGSDQLRRG